MEVSLLPGDTVSSKPEASWTWSIAITVRDGFIGSCKVTYTRLNYEIDQSIYSIHEQNALKWEEIFDRLTISGRMDIPSVAFFF